MPTDPPAKTGNLPATPPPPEPGTADRTVHEESQTVTQDGWTVTVTSRTESRSTSTRSEERKVTLTRRDGRRKPGK